MPEATTPAQFREAGSQELHTATIIRNMDAVYLYSTSDSPLVRSELDCPAPNPITPTTSIQGSTYTVEESRVISQCEMCLPSCSAVGLTGESPLSGWMEAWSEAGILNETVSAMLGDLSALVLMLGRHRAKLAEIPEREWPVLGLRSQLETERIELNKIARIRASLPCHKVYHPKATSICLHLGADAPLVEWIRFWQSAGMVREVVAAVSGIGFRYLPGTSISQCEINRASYRISLFTTGKAKRQRADYVLSGYWYDGQQSTYAYHPLTRHQIPSIDSHNWITGHRLGMTRQLRSSHPLELIKDVMGDRISEVGGKHCLGLHIESLSSEAVSSAARPESHDVIDQGALEAALECPSHCEAIAQRRMPGVYPATWLVASGGESNGDDVVAQLTRPVSGYEAEVNEWLHRVATHVALPAHDSVSFRIAKFRLPKVGDAETHLLSYPSSGFTVGTTEHSAVISNFRLPIGSLMSAGLILHGESRPSMELAIKQLAMLLGDIVVNPASDLRKLMHWIVFDALNGTLPQMPYRYQVVLTEEGLELAAVPFWSSESACAFREQTQRQFGFQIELDVEAVSSLLTNKILDDVSSVAGLAHGELASFRDECITALQLGVPAHSDADAQVGDSFRNAKWTIEGFMTKAKA